MRVVGVVVAACVLAGCTGVPPVEAEAEAECVVPLVVAHRGAGAEENTVASVRAAAASGADAVEIDARVADDGTLVAFHDRHPQPGQVMPHLGPVLDAVAAADMPLWLEVKPPADPAGVRRILDEATTRDLDVTVLSFDGGILATVAEAAPELPAVLLRAEDDTDPADVAETVHAETYAPKLDWFDPADVAGLDAAGVGVAVWTVDDPRSWDMLRDAGVDVLITDEPEAASAWADAVC